MLQRILFEDGERVALDKSASDEPPLANTFDYGRTDLVLNGEALPDYEATTLRRAFKEPSKQKTQPQRHPSTTSIEVHARDDEAKLQEEVDQILKVHGVVVDQRHHPYAKGPQRYYLQALKTGFVNLTVPGDVVVTYDQFEKVPENVASFKVYYATGLPWVREMSRDTATSWLTSYGLLDRALEGKDKLPHARYQIVVDAATEGARDEVALSTSAHENVHGKDWFAALEEIVIPWEKRWASLVGKSFTGTAGKVVAAEAAAWSEAERAAGGPVAPPFMFESLHERIRAGIIAFHGHSEGIGRAPSAKSVTVKDDVITIVVQAPDPTAIAKFGGL